MKTENKTPASTLWPSLTTATILLGILAASAGCQTIHTGVDAMSEVSAALFADVKSAINRDQDQDQADPQDSPCGK